MNLLFLHGWGFDRHLWDALRPLLPQGEHAVDDRGYFFVRSIARKSLPRSSP
ncbi:hypothetical protein ACFSTD_21440 [Novosphingobium colocasiae]